MTRRTNNTFGSLTEINAAEHSGINYQLERRISAQMVQIEFRCSVRQQWINDPVKWTRKPAFLRKQVNMERLHIHFFTFFGPHPSSKFIQSRNFQFKADVSDFESKHSVATIAIILVKNSHAHKRDCVVKLENNGCLFAEASLKGVISLVKSMDTSHCNQSLNQLHCNQSLN